MIFSILQNFFREFLFSEHNSVCEKASSNYARIYECSLRAYDEHANTFMFSRYYNMSS